MPRHASPCHASPSLAVPRLTSPGPATPCRGSPAYDLAVRLAIGEREAGEGGWTTVDLFGGDLQREMWDLLGICTGEVEEIRCVHALEHVPKAKVLPTLREWHRVLRPGGRLTVDVPDLDYIARHWLEHEAGPITDAWALDIIFGNQGDEGQFHMTGFNSRLLEAAITAAGFAGASITPVWSHGQMCLFAVAMR